MLAAEGGSRQGVPAFLQLNPAEGDGDDDAPPLSHVLAQVWMCGCPFTSVGRGVEGDGDDEAPPLSHVLAQVWRCDA